MTRQGALFIEEDEQNEELHPRKSLKSEKQNRVHKIIRIINHYAMNTI